jgi:hypothetical protein
MITLLSDYVDRPALCRALKVPASTIAAYERRGLPSMMLAGRRMYRLSAVRGWLAGRSGASLPPDPPEAA